MAVEGIIKRLSESYIDYIMDESGFVGNAEEISFPSCDDELKEIIFHLLSQKKPFTVQGAKTGIVGAAVPTGWHILNLSRMNRITGMEMKGSAFSLIIQPGVTLSEIENGLAMKTFDTRGWPEESLAAFNAFRRAERHFFPPDPTEKTATIGGMFACNAGGINAGHYGKTNTYIEAISVIMPSREMWVVERGQYVFDEKGCVLPNGMFFDQAFFRKRNAIHSLTAEPGMDLIDFFAGSEGMLGVIISLTLRLLPEPSNKWGVVCFFSDASSPVRFANILLHMTFEHVQITAIEYFDKTTLECISRLRAIATSLHEIPEIDSGIAAAVYVELISEEQADDAMEKALQSLLTLLAEQGGSEDKTWAASGPDEMEKLRKFRHAAPEAMNMKLEENRRKMPEITKISTDFSAPDKYLEMIFEMYSHDLKICRIPGALFGHINNCHLHVNFLPESIEQMREAHQIVECWARKIMDMGGCLAEENGIGKLKKHMLLLAMTEGDRLELKKTKLFFDREELLNPGNMIP